MDAVGRAQIKELLDEALRRPASERAAFIRDACGSDGDLCRELLSLAAAHDAAEGFLETPPSLTLTGTSPFTHSWDTATAPSSGSVVRAAFAPGTLINGRYRTEGILGAGGM